DRRSTVRLAPRRARHGPAQRHWQAARFARRSDGADVAIPRRCHHAALAPAHAGFTLQHTRKVGGRDARPTVKFLCFQYDRWCRRLACEGIETPSEFAATRAPSRPAATPPRPAEWGGEPTQVGLAPLLPRFQPPGVQEEREFALN